MAVPITRTVQAALLLLSLSCLGCSGNKYNCGTIAGTVALSNEHRGVPTSEEERCIDGPTKEGVVDRFDATSHPPQLEPSAVVAAGDELYPSKYRSLSVVPCKEECKKTHQSCKSGCSGKKDRAHRSTCKARCKKKRFRCNYGCYCSRCRTQCEAPVKECIRKKTSAEEKVECYKKTNAATMDCFKSCCVDCGKPGMTCDKDSPPCCEGLRCRENKCWPPCTEKEGDPCNPGANRRCCPGMDLKCIAGKCRKKTCSVTGELCGEDGLPCCTDLGLVLECRDNFCVPRKALCLGKGEPCGKDSLPCCKEQGLSLECRGGKCRNKKPCKKTKCLKGRGRGRQEGQSCNPKLKCTCCRGFLCQDFVCESRAYFNKFEKPNRELSATNGAACDVFDSSGIDVLYGKGNHRFNEAFEAEAVIHDSSFNNKRDYKQDPEKRGGKYSIGLLSSQNDDLLALSIEHKGYKYLNVRMDVSVIGLAPRCQGQNNVNERPENMGPYFNVSLLDGVNEDGLPRLPNATNYVNFGLDSKKMSFVPGPNLWTYKWTRAWVSLSTAGAQNEKVSIGWDLDSESGASFFGVFDNLKITRSNGKVEPTPPPTTEVPSSTA